jgi:acylphosphatase
MNKCLKITFFGNLPDDFLTDVVQRYAKKLQIEGVAQHDLVHGRSIKVIACGAKDDVDMFLDSLYKDAAESELEGVEAEPFIKDRSYRGVFRIIE